MCYKVLQNDIRALYVSQQPPSKAGGGPHSQGIGEMCRMKVYSNNAKLRTTVHGAVLYIYSTLPIYRACESIVQSEPIDEAKPIRSSTIPTNSHRSLPSGCVSRA